MTDPAAQWLAEHEAAERRLEDKGGRFRPPVPAPATKNPKPSAPVSPWPGTREEWIAEYVACSRRAAHTRG